jgi:hypothetical protein
MLLPIRSDPIPHRTASQRNNQYRYRYRIPNVAVCSPFKPSDIAWEEHYPEAFADFRDGKRLAPPHVEMADVGCGFGGLLGT